MTLAQILSMGLVNCPLDLFCFLFILHRTKELHLLNKYHVLTKVIIWTIKFFLIKVTALTLNVNWIQSNFKNIREAAERRPIVILENHSRLKRFWGKYKIYDLTIPQNTTIVTSTRISCSIFAAFWRFSLQNPAMLTVTSPVFNHLVILLIIWQKTHHIPLGRH